VSLVQFAVLSAATQVFQNRKEANLTETQAGEDMGQAPSLEATVAHAESFLAQVQHLKQERDAAQARCHGAEEELAAEQQKLVVLNSISVVRKRKAREEKSIFEAKIARLEEELHAKNIRIQELTKKTSPDVNVGRVEKHVTFQVDSGPEDSDDDNPICIRRAHQVRGYDELP
jgi:predicted  nucleic acid-binding Zn-ribbon protein